MLYWQDMKKKFRTNSTKIRRFLRIQDEFGTNCAVDKHTKTSVKILVEIRISVYIQMNKYRPIISVERYYRSVSKTSQANETFMTRTRCITSKRVTS